MRIRMPVGDFQQFYNRVCVEMSRSSQMQYPVFILEYKDGVLCACSEDGETVFASIVIIDRVLGAVVDELLGEGFVVDFGQESHVIRASAGVSDESRAEIRHSDGKLILSCYRPRHSGLMRLAVKLNYATDHILESFDLAVPDSIERLMSRMREIL